MRRTRTKKSKRIITFYQRAFQFREPYQIILDAEFVQTALLCKIFLKEQLKSLLLGNVKLMTTPCIISYLKDQGDEYFGAYVACKQYEPRRCMHSDPLSPDHCIKSIIGDSNRVKCIIATQNESLSRDLSLIPGVPTIHIYRGILIFDSITNSSQRSKSILEQSKSHVPEKEKKFLQLIAPIESIPNLKRPILKKAKGPNPLSVKKKKQ